MVSCKRERNYGYSCLSFSISLRSYGFYLRSSARLLKLSHFPQTIKQRKLNNLFCGAVAQITGCGSHRNSIIPFPPAHDYERKFQYYVRFMVPDPRGPARRVVCGDLIYATVLVSKLESSAEQPMKKWAAAMRASRECLQLRKTAQFLITVV